MLQNTDLVLLLNDLETQGIDVSSQMSKAIMSEDIPLDVVKFINDRRKIDIAEFYKQIRKNYNAKKSNLYKNIVFKELEPQEYLTTLSAFLLQVILYSKHVKDDTMFFRHTRVEEITKVLNNYFNTYDIISIIKILKLIRADILAFEYIDGRRTETGEKVQ